MLVNLYNIIPKGEVHLAKVCPNSNVSQAIIFLRLVHPLISNQKVIRTITILVLSITELPLKAHILTVKNCNQCKCKFPSLPL